MEIQERKMITFFFRVEPIRTLVMDSTGKYVASAGDRQIRVFHNIAGEIYWFDSMESKLLRYIDRSTRIDR